MFEVETSQENLSTQERYQRKREIGGEQLLGRIGLIFLTGLAITDIEDSVRNFSEGHLPFNVAIGAAVTYAGYRLLKKDNALEKEYKQL